MWGTTRVHSGTVTVSHIREWHATQAVKSNLFLYADDSCLVFQGKDVIEIEKQLNEYFTDICALVLDNILSIHFGEGKTKSILFASKCKIKRVPKLKMKYKNKQIKQHSKVAYLGCILDGYLLLTGYLLKTDSINP